MIVSAAVCPGAPLLVAGLAPALASTVPDLIAGCRSAVASLSGADRILLLTSGPRARDRAGPDARDRAGLDAPRVLIHSPGTVVSSAVLGNSRGPAIFEGHLAGSFARSSATHAGTGSDGTVTASSSPGVGVIVGAALLAAAGIDVPTTAVELAEPTTHDLAGRTGSAASSPADAATQLLLDVGDSAERVALLVIAEGSASRGPSSPGGGDVRADRLDGDLGAALADGDPAALAAAVIRSRSMATALMFTAGATLTAFAELTLPRPPLRAELLYQGAPFGVGYFVATWTWPDRIDPEDRQNGVADVGTGAERDVGTRTER